MGLYPGIKSEDLGVSDVKLCCVHKVSTTLVADSTDGEHTTFKVDGGS